MKKRTIWTIAIIMGLSFMGLPCPNIFAGGHNFHGRFEMIAIEDMKKAADLIVQIAKNAVNLKY